MESVKRPEKLRGNLPTGRDPAAIRARVEAMEKVLERGFTIPGIGYEFGLDALIGLIPVAGDAIAAAMGSYLIWEARNLGMSRWQMTRMAGNIGLDLAVGAVPLIGDAFDFAFRSNTRNLKIIRRHLDRHHPETQIIEG